MIQSMRNLVPTSVAIGLLLCHWIPAHGDNPRTSANRHVTLEGQSNFRDIGGYRTKNGKTVEPGLVYRSGELPRLTDKDVAKLKQLGIKTVVNFLTDEETNDRGKDRLPSGVREVSEPIESDGGLVVAVNQARKTADYIDATRDEILKKHGSIDGYLAKGLGLTKRDIQGLRERLLK